MGSTRARGTAASAESGRAEVLLTSVQAIATNGTVAVLIAVGTLLLPGLVDPPGTAVRWIAIPIGVALAVLMNRAPWPRWLERGHAVTALVTAMTIAAVVVGLGVADSGGTVSRYVWLWGLQVLFAGAVLPRRATIGFVTFVLIVYAVAANLHGAFLLGEFVFRGGVLVLAATMARVLAAGWAATADLAQARADALTTVATAARALPMLDPTAVLEDVADRVTDLGYDTVGVFVQDGPASLRHAATRGVAADLRSFGVRPGQGIAGRVYESHGTIVAETYQGGEDGRVRCPVRSAIGTPIFVHGEVSGALVAGTTTARRFAPHDVEALELLAGLAGRALETAAAYTAQLAVTDELRQLDRARDDFVSTVSHELRTPLTVIYGNVGTVLDRWDELDETLKLDLLSRLRSNAGRLDGVIGALLDLARLEEGNLETRHERFDLSAVVTEAIDNLRPLLVHHDLDTSGVHEDVIAYGDARLIERAVENLLSNARRHTDDGTRIAVRVAAAGSRATVEVVDHGPGIPLAEQERLGERFFRGQGASARAARGVGLGLALTVQVLRLHDSELVVRSEPGKGSSFSFTLDRALMAAHGSGPRSRAEAT